MHEYAHTISDRLLLACRLVQGWFQPHRLPRDLLLGHADFDYLPHFKHLQQQGIASELRSGDLVYIVLVGEAAGDRTCSLQ